MGEKRTEDRGAMMEKNGKEERRNAWVFSFFSLPLKKINSPRVGLQQLQDSKHDVVDVAKARRLGLLGVVHPARPVEANVGPLVVEQSSAADRAARVELEILCIIVYYGEMKKVSERESERENQTRQRAPKRARCCLKEKRKRERRRKGFLPLVPCSSLLISTFRCREEEKSELKKKSHRAVLKHPVEDRAIRLPDASQVEPSHLRQVLVLVVRRHRLEELDVVVGMKLFNLQLGAWLGTVEHHRLFEVVVRDQGVGEAYAVRPHGVAAAVVERACVREGGEEVEK